MVEAFELYMWKKFLNVELNTLTNNMLNFWEKDFDKVMNKHIEFLKENLEYQNEYSLKFSELLQEMDIFKNEDNEETREENQDDGQIILLMMTKTTIQMILEMKITMKRLKRA